MKKLFVLIMILAMLPIICFADPAEPSDKYQTFGSTEYTKGMFSGDYFSIDVFFSFDLNAYIQITTWDYHDVSTITKHGAIKSRKDNPGVLYIVFPDDSYYTYTYEGDAREYIWLNIDDLSIRLGYSQWFNPYSDFKEQ